MLRLIPAVLFLLLPLGEIACFILVGRQIGVLPTLSLVLLSGVLGILLMRIQGFGALLRLRQAAQEGKLPGREMLDAAMIVVAGLLLLIPGFLTDVLGIALFLPPVRQWVWKRLLKGVVVVDIPSSTPDADRRQPEIHTIDLDSDDFQRNSER
ncbi:FxsA family protein [Sinorhizobium sp. BG8]|uniref:FxsA family protein n=1 Tax=Sinorhizobium sp. BG8 TaxID=2613773 RepID=UPI00193D5B7F|nr:FxsA family protein [Sinorhizobium sp. BG8]QRM53642.1 membrane protein FxsA [Sinorhizobium sp. BG8]